LDRNIREKWLASGGTNLGQRLNTRVKEILKEHHPTPLEAEKKTQLQEILAQAAQQV
jgi:trimethylamine:corrinoid methyltransferase-like protein